MHAPWLLSAAPLLARDGTWTCSPSSSTDLPFNFSQSWTKCVHRSMVKGASWSSRSLRPSRLEVGRDSCGFQHSALALAHLHLSFLTRWPAYSNSGLTPDAEAAAYTDCPRVHTLEHGLTPITKPYSVPFLVMLLL